MDGVRGIADQREPRLHVALGMTLAQWNAQPRIDLLHLAQTLLEGTAQRRAERHVIQRHQAPGF